MTKHKPKCPYGHRFGRDGIGKKECDKCPLSESCGRAAFEYDKRRREAKAEAKRKARLEREKAKPRKQKNKKTAKPKKKKPFKKKKDDLRPIQFETDVFDKLLWDLPRPHNTNCVILELFYIRTGLYQKTNKIWCNNTFAAGKIEEGKKRKGLKWDAARVSRTKKILVKLKHIKIIPRKRDAKGHFIKKSKEYILLKFYPSKMKVENEVFLRQLDEYERKYQKMLDADLDLVTELATTIDKVRIELAKCKKSRLRWKRKCLKLEKNI